MMMALTRLGSFQDYKDPLALLSPSNVRTESLLDYIRDTCDYCTDYQLPNLSFALNHKGQPDVALFDFTSMFAARNSIFVKERNGKQLLSFIIGDGLLEVLDQSTRIKYSFWPFSLALLADWHWLRPRFPRRV